MSLGWSASKVKKQKKKDFSCTGATSAPLKLSDWLCLLWHYEGFVVRALRPVGRLQEIQSISEIDRVFHQRPTCSQKHIVDQPGLFNCGKPTSLGLKASAEMFAETDLSSE